MVVLQVKKGELAKDMCTLIAILSDFIEDRPTAEDNANNVNLVEKMDVHVRRISEGLKGNSAVEVIWTF